MVPGGVPSCAGQGAFEFRGPGVDRRVRFPPRRLEQLDQPGIGEPLEPLDAHEQGFPLRLLDFLGEPLEPLDALVACREDVDPSFGRDRPEGAQASPDRDPRARAPPRRQGVGENDPQHRC